MKKKEKGRKRTMLWGLIYAGTFLSAFAVSAVIKLTYNPLTDKMQTDWNNSVGRVCKDISYGEGDANTFDLYLPADNTKESYGLVVYLHAGGFTSGDKSDDSEMLKWLCSKGYVAAGINYTLFGETHPEASVYSQSQEIKASIPVVAAQAGELGYPLDRMAIAGGSAGGCLALIYAYRDAADSPLPVKMVFEAVGPSSFYPEDWTPYGLDKNPEAAAGLFSVMSGTPITTDMLGTPDYDEAVRDISAFLWIDENSVPTVCAYGAYDKICPFATSRHLVRALEENGVPHDYIEFPHSGHGLQNDNDCSARYVEKIEEYLALYMADSPEC